MEEIDRLEDEMIRSNQSQEGGMIPDIRYQILEVRSNEEEEGKEADKPGQSQLAVEPGKCSLQGCVLCNSRTRKSREGL